VTMVGQGVFSDVSRHVPCLDCHQEMFQWSPWGTFGKLSIRTRGSASILNSFQTDESVACPDGWSHFNLSCYILIKKSLSWRGAEGYCNKLGGHLASVHSLEENDFISGLADGEYWIGANDMKTEGQWVWSDGSAY